MASKSSRRKGIDETLVKVIAHPLRVQALSILAERSASPKELAAELGAPVGNISYHVRELERACLIELVDEKKRRGAIEHFYRAIEMPLLSESAWRKLSFKGRQRISAWTLQLLLADAANALGAGSFDARSDRHLSRTQLLVDERGWNELVEIQIRALQATLKVKAASDKRLAGADAEQAIPAVAGMACFELPPTRRPAS